MRLLAFAVALGLAGWRLLDVSANLAKTGKAPAPPNREFARFIDPDGWFAAEFPGKPSTVALSRHLESLRRGSFAYGFAVRCLTFGYDLRPDAERNFGWLAKRSAKEHVGDQAKVARRRIFQTPDGATAVEVWAHREPGKNDAGAAWRGAVYIMGEWVVVAEATGRTLEEVNRPDADRFFASVEVTELARREGAGD